MPMSSGFLQLRRGIFDHVRDGRLTQMEAFVLIYMFSQADTRTGVWSGSAGALNGEIGIPLRNARRILENLSNNRYIKRFTVPGQKVCYPILLHKYRISTGEHIGQQLNAIDSISKDRLQFFPREHNGGEDVQHSSSQRILETGDRRKNPRAQTARGILPSLEDEQRRKLAARDRRLAMEDEVLRDAYVGAGPVVNRDGTDQREYSSEHEDLMQKLHELAAAKQMK